MLEKTENSSEDTWIKDVANELYKLTYSPEPKNKGMWHKRTRSAFRDYLKGNLHRVDVREAVEKYKGKYPEHVLEKWRNPEPYLDQLELPGDIWNTRFFDRIDGYYLKPLLGENYVKKGKKAQEKVRELYEKFQDDAKAQKLYPEQFDVTFDFYRLFCSKSDWKGHCKICPLGSNKITEICIGPLKSAEKKYCPVVSLLCDYYFMECKSDDCPLFNNSTRELCPSFQK